MIDIFITMSTENNIKNKKSLLFKDLFESNENTNTFLKCKRYAVNEDTNVLITGETGTGKEIHARYIHSISPRKDKPFIIANFSDIPETLASSILFGHTKGSFTGATDNHDGFFKAANGGTIFLDEIGDAKPGVQAALLRVIDYGEILPVGKQHPEEVDVRIISASNINFQEKIEQKEFRLDLFHRLKGAEIHLKPFRMYPASERKSILQRIITDTARYKDRNAFVLNDSAWDILLPYKFPGNFREAREIIKNLYALNKDTIDVSDLSDLLITLPTVPIGAPDELNTFNPITDKSVRPMSLKDWDAYIIHNIIEKHNGTIKYAARELDIDEKTVKKHLKHYHDMENISGNFPTGDRKKSERTNEND